MKQQEQNDNIHVLELIINVGTKSLEGLFETGTHGADVIMDQ